MIGHIAPEAADGGPIGLIEDGDHVTVDIPERDLTVDLSEEELAERREEWEAPAPQYEGASSRSTRATSPPPPTAR